jgi:hypothetical protein
LINLEDRQVDVRRELDRLGVEIRELHASLKHLVLDADADRLIERELHQSVQQHLVALVVRRAQCAAAPGRRRLAHCRRVRRLHRKAVPRERILGSGAPLLRGDRPLIAGA